jgi:hypothetical protein
LPAPADNGHEEREEGACEAAIRAWTDTLRLPPADVRHGLVRAAQRLAAALDANGRDLPGIARDLQILVAPICDFESEADRLNEMRSRQGQRRVLGILFQGISEAS